MPSALNCASFPPKNISALGSISASKHFAAGNGEENKGAQST
jgi:hypothetical protein